MTDRLDEIRARAARDWMGCTRTRVESDARDLLGEVERLKGLEAEWAQKLLSKYEVMDGGKPTTEDS